MIDWNTVQCFVTVVQRGSLSEAGRALGLSVATLSRRIDQLESQTGAKLLRRGPNGTQLTDAGRFLYAHAEDGARHLTQLSRAARTLLDGPQQGAARITSTEMMIADVLAPNIQALHAADPTIRVELDVSNAQTDLNAGDADIAIRMVRPESETLVTRKLPTIRMGLFCSACYLGRRNQDKVRLPDERLLWLASSYGDIAENRWLLEKGLEAAVIMRASSVRALLNAAVAGVGIAPLPAHSATAAGLIELPSDGLAPRHPWLAFHRDMRKNQRMQVIRRWIIATCKSSFG